MVILIILSWIFLAFVLLGFLYLILNWILAREANYLFKNNKEKWLFIFKRFSFLILIIIGITLFLTSIDTIPLVSSPDIIDYTPGENFPWQ